MDANGNGQNGTYGQGAGAPVGQPAAYRQYPQNGVRVYDGKYYTDSQLRPLSAWAYFGYGLLFSIPIVGFILLIVFSVDDSNVNRRNYARSYWCWLIIAAVAVVLMIILAVVGTGVLAGLLRYMR